MIRGALLVAAALAVAGAPARADAAATDPWPGVASAYLVRIDGEVRWAANDAARMKPASLTKMMTAVLVVEALAPSSEVVVSKRAATADGVRLGLRAGMRLPVEHLLAAALLRSANDACLALAERVAGSEAAFVARMNERAAALGLADTHFANACGFDAPDHYASARDLARLADAALDRPRIAAIVARESGTAKTSDGRLFRFDNTNVLIGRVDGARGVKTGWTRAAGRCLVAMAERAGTRVLVVMLGAPDRWWDAVAMIESAFEDARARTAPPAAAFPTRP
ncbi:MAG: D-alanyl-D-alanine carboxypeptidase [Betaproteobacteria bacterium]|nr:D-alanyl-D-alanine carboxypeptidase [Betaproteobacteria bacterium]